MKRLLLIGLTMCVASLALGDTVPWLHDVSVRVSLKSRLKDYRQEFPWPLTQAIPEYPTKCREEGVTGEARLRFTVSTKGEVSGVRVVASSQKEFAESAIAAVKKWTFRPGLDADRKTPISFELEYLFLFERHEE
jgi:TonB family protein